MTGLKILKKNLNKLINKKLIPFKQKSKGSFYKKIPSSNQINWASESQRIYNMFVFMPIHFLAHFPKLKTEKYI